MENEIITEEPTIPFKNLFLVKGFVTGKNQLWMYLFGILAAFLGYLTFQLIMMVPLMSAATSKGISHSEILANPNIFVDQRQKIK